MINDQNDWYSIFNIHKSNLRTIVSTYNRSELNKFDNLSVDKFQNGLELISILNTAWFNAPDNNAIHSIPSWGTLCNLCSESWVFEE